MTPTTTDQQAGRLTVSTWSATALSAIGLAVRAAPGAVIAYVALAVVGAVAPVATAWLLKLVMDGLVAGAALSSLLGLAGGLAVAGVVTAVEPQVTQYVRAESERRLGLLSLDRLYSAVNRFVGLGRFEDPTFHDRLRLAQQTSRTAPFDVLSGVIGGSQGSIMIVGFLGSLAAVNTAMAMVALAAAVPAVVMEVVLVRLRTTMMWRISPTARREFFYAKLLGDLRAAKEVRLFGIGTFLRLRMLDERRAANLAERRVDRRELLSQGGLVLLSAAVAGGGLVWAVGAARSGRLSIGDVAMFVAAIAGVQNGLGRLIGDFGISHRGVLLFEHHLAVVRSGPELPIRAEPTPAPPLRHGIEVRDVWFRYTPDHPWVLRGVNLFIPCGRALAVVGRNGAGKSTLVKLLCRFYDPSRGAVLWDGVDLRDMTPEALRTRIGAVFQDFMEYDLTASENIGLGDLTALGEPARLEQAARTAGVHETLTGLPHGYETLLSRTFPVKPGQSAGNSTDQAADAQKIAPYVGVSLSTGQWQRVALARALVRDRRDLLILDEPSSGLDAEAEYEVHAALREHAAGSARVLISHRMGAIRTADHIVVLVDGRVAEQGDHDLLIAEDGEYARLFNLQADGYGDASAKALDPSLPEQ
ncbi:ABC transporter ATP-binding protein [Actinomadura sp. HBU206391]|uniref:ABC transporter ATP-binding protein n=1 Tax=Actinomadura sp. HBU206391 TaxID=2731692 RepID=UPI00164F7E9F|nr:ABC transporter ATP-binding protein [Actinomadura sp. HBU206391]MBC6459729.1 ABC transporter ATP-binding protein [Actinomadura sp. HBU206391]